MKKGKFWQKNLVIRMNEDGLRTEPSVNDHLWTMSYRDLRDKALRLLGRSRSPLSASAIVTELVIRGLLPSTNNVGRLTGGPTVEIGEADFAVYEILEELSKSGRVVGERVTHRPVYRRRYSLGSALDRMARL